MNGEGLGRTVLVSGNLADNGKIEKVSSLDMALRALIVQIEITEGYSEKLQVRLASIVEEVPTNPSSDTKDPKASAALVEQINVLHRRLAEANERIAYILNNLAL